MQGVCLWDNSLSWAELRWVFFVRIYRNACRIDMKLTARNPMVLPPRILVLRIGAPDFLAALDNLVDKLIPTHGTPQALVISLRQMVLVDAPGLRALETTVGRLRAHGVKVLLVEASVRVKGGLEKCRLLEALGENSYYDNFAAAVAHCYTLNGGVRDRRLRLVDAYAESMLGDSCGYLQVPLSACPTGKAALPARSRK